MINADAGEMNYSDINSESVKKDELNVEDEAEENESEAPLIRYDITSYGIDFDVDGLVKRLKRGDIYIPRFQREFVWKITESSRFIESLLLGLPVPGIFLAKDPKDNRFLVIDGQQRLRSLQFFMDGYFNPQKNAKNKRVFKLTKVQPQFDKKTIDTLDPNDRRNLENTLIHATIVQQDSPKNDDTSIYHIFERLNTSGKKLQPQEIRLAIYPGTLIKLIGELNHHPSWREIYGRLSPTLKDQELILRFLAFYFEPQHYAKPMKEFLNLFVLRNQNGEEEFITRCRETFIQSIDLIYESIGKKAFRPNRAINAAIFESVMCGVSHRVAIGKTEINLKKLNKVYSSLLENENYIEAYTQHTSDEDRIRVRMNLAKEYFQNA